MKTRLLTVVAMPVLTATLATATLAASALAAPVRAGGDDGRVIRTGDCSGPASWKIKAKPDDGRIEVEAEIDSNRAGQSWAWTLRHEGDLAARGTTNTVGRSGSFSIERRTTDAAGADSFTFRATHGQQTCVARVTLP